jgi:hypothetical protein
VASSEWGVIMDREAPASLFALRKRCAAQEERGPGRGVIASGSDAIQLEIGEGCD